MRGKNHLFEEALKKGNKKRPLIKAHSKLIDLLKDYSQNPVRQYTLFLKSRKEEPEVNAERISFSRPSSQGAFFDSWV